MVSVADLDAPEGSTDGCSGRGSPQGSFDWIFHMQAHLPKPLPRLRDCFFSRSLVSKQRVPGLVDELRSVQQLCSCRRRRGDSGNQANAPSYRYFYQNGSVIPGTDFRYTLRQLLIGCAHLLLGGTCPFPPPFRRESRKMLARCVAS